MAVWNGANATLKIMSDQSNNAYVFAQNGFLGHPTGKKIRLPKNWSH